MRSSSTIAIILVLVLGILINHINCDDDDEYVTIDESENKYEAEFTDTDIKIPKKRILWPYPVNYKADKSQNEDTNGQQSTNVKEDEGVQQQEKEGKRRKGRFLLWSYPQSPIVNMMMQTAAVNYSPQNSNDPFDFLRDSYPLPKGKKFFIVSILR